MHECPGTEQLASVNPVTNYLRNVMTQEFDYLVAFHGEVRREPTRDDSRAVRRNWFVTLPKKGFTPRRFEPNPIPLAPSTSHVKDQTWIVVSVIAAIMGGLALNSADVAVERGYQPVPVYGGLGAVAAASFLLVLRWRSETSTEATADGSAAATTPPAEAGSVRSAFRRWRREALIAGIGVVLLILGHVTRDSSRAADDYRGAIVWTLICGLVGGGALLFYRKREARGEQQRQRLLEDHQQLVRPIQKANEEAEARTAAWNRQAEASVRLHNETAVPVLSSELMLQQREVALDKAREQLRSDLSIPYQEWEEVADNPSRFLTVMHALSWVDGDELLEPRSIAEAAPSGSLEALRVPVMTRAILSPRYTIIQAVVFDAGFARHEVEWNCVTQSFSPSAYRRLLWGAVAMVERDRDPLGYHVLKVESTGGSLLEITLAGTGVDYRGRLGDVGQTPDADAFVTELQRRSIVGRG